MLPSGVREIGDFAFQYCSSLVGVRIPKSLVKIGKYAFTKKPWFVYCEGTLSDWEQIEIGSDNEGLDGSNLYFYSEVQPTDADEKAWHYVNDVPTIW